MNNEFESAFKRKDRVAVGIPLYAEDFDEQDISNIIQKNGDEIVSVLYSVFPHEHKLIEKISPPHTPTPLERKYSENKKIIVSRVYRKTFDKKFDVDKLLLSYVNNKLSNRLEIVDDKISEDSQALILITSTSVRQDWDAFWDWVKVLTDLHMPIIFILLNSHYTGSSIITNNDFESAFNRKNRIVITVPDDSRGWNETNLSNIIQQNGDKIVSLLSNV
jgi:transcription termination factor NusB